MFKLVLKNCLVHPVPPQLKLTNGMRTVVQLRPQINKAREDHNIGLSSVGLRLIKCSSHTRDDLLGFHGSPLGPFLFMRFVQRLLASLFLSSVGKGNSLKGGGQSHRASSCKHSCISHFCEAHFFNLLPLLWHPTTAQFRFPNPISIVFWPRGKIKQREFRG
jgi:hypothetical protein